MEKRKYVRFSVQDNAFAAIRSEFEKIGKLNDISEKGLSFSYLIENIKVFSDKNNLEVDIFLSGNGYHLEKVPCKIVYDIEDPKSDKTYNILKHRCGLQFGELNNSQSELLELFLKNFTTGPLNW